MFIDRQDINSIQYYEKMLATVGSLSRLFSDSDEPYLVYRAVENLFCRSFKADNLSRADTSVDAAKQNLGIGIKTFLYKGGRSYEKIAEFNKELDLFNNLHAEEKVSKIAELRNERINFTQRNYRLQDMIYHCVTRKPNRISVYEYPMNRISVDRIRSIQIEKNSIRFRDNNSSYSFNISKSTLFRQFISDISLLDIDVQIIPDPFKALDSMIEGPSIRSILTPMTKTEHIFLPLYSYVHGSKYVPEKSGLNQWNASGRPRNPNEIYVPIPRLIHQKYPQFFPERDTSFKLILPNKSVLIAKVCQDNSKALMTNPNSALGEWLLGDVLNLKELELLTYRYLETLGVDSVVIYKESMHRYSIDFAKIGAFEEFTGRSLEPISDE